MLICKLQGRNILIIDSTDFVEWDDGSFDTVEQQETLLKYCKLKRSAQQQQQKTQRHRCQPLQNRKLDGFYYLHLHINLHGKIDGIYCMAEQVNHMFLKFKSFLHDSLLKYNCCYLPLLLVVLPSDLGTSDNILKFADFCVCVL